MIDVYVMAISGTHLLDLASVSETFRMANSFGADYKFHLIGPDESASCSMGVSLGGIEPLPDTLSQGATVLIPGVTGCAHENPRAAHVAAWLARVVGPSHRLCTVCSGVFFAAMSGLLNGKSCTTHHEHTDELAREYPQLNVEENRVFVQDGQTYTSAGVTTGVDLALHLVSVDYGPKVALEVARTLVIYFRRAGTDLQLSPWLHHRNHMHRALHRVQDAVVREPAKPWTLASLAREACTSPRHLERLFIEHAGITPTTYVRKIRMAAAKELMHARQHNLGRVAEMVGFNSAEQLRRAWRRFEGTSPSEARRNQA